MPNGSRSHQLAKFVARQSGVANDSGQCKGLDWIVARNGDLPLAIAHDDVLTLSDDFEADLFEGTYRLQMIDARDPCHKLHRYFDIAHIGVTQLIVQSS